ncbi:MAG: ribosome rescue protein RqcH [Candidatus Helarchaeota archaeon]
MKYSMSNFDIFAIVSELKTKISESRVQKIYQIENIFIFKFRTKSGTFNLLIETPSRIHITEYERVKPKVPPNFCVKLRKSLKNLRVCNIYQHNFDRVVVLELGYFGSEKNSESSKETVLFKVIFEFFDKGNVVLTDGKNIVISALRYKTMRNRRIIPNREFTLPSSHGQNIMDLKFEDFVKIIENSKKRFIPTLVNNLNIGPIYAEEICLRANIDPNLPLSSILEKKEIIFKEIENLLELYKSRKFNPQIIYKNSDLFAISAVDLKIYQDSNKKRFNTINEAADDFYSIQEDTIEKRQVQKEITESQKKVKRLEKILSDQREQVNNLLRKSEKNKMYGDLMYQNLGFIQQLLDFINNSRKNNVPWDLIIEQLKTKKENGVDFAQIMNKINPNQASIELEINGKKFQIDFRDSPTKTANNYYQQSKKQLRKVAGAKKAIQNTLKKFEAAKLEDSIAKPVFETPKKKRTKKWYEKFHWLYSSNGFLILGGRDVKTNEILVKKHMRDNDIFIHATFAGAPAIIIQTEGKEVPEESILEGAQLAISYSSAWKLGYSQADVFWVKGSQVTFTPPSGEYRKKGSFIIEGTKNNLKDIPAKLKIGIKIEEDYLIPVIAPNERKKEILFPIEITPGDLKSSDLAKQIKSYWLSKATEIELKNKIKRLNIDEIQRLIPAGKGRILK